MIFIPIIGHFGVHAIFQTDVSGAQHDWAMKLIRRSLYKASSTEEYVLQQRDMAEQIDLLVKWQDYLVSRSIMILVATEKSSPVGFINDRLDDTFVIIFGTERAFPKSSFCAGRKIKLEEEQTCLIVTEREVEEQVYPTNLVDFMSLCYDIDHETESMLVACVNGDLVNDKCICLGLRIFMLFFAFKLNDLTRTVLRILNRIQCVDYASYFITCEVDLLSSYRRTG